MTNLLLTEHCVRSCPYCFAKKHMKDSPGGSLNWADLMYVADFLRLGNCLHLSLLGGEPTLHPEFVTYVRYLHARGFDLTVFTSGVLAENTLAGLIAAVEGLKDARERISFVCNVNHPSISPDAELQRQYAFLDALGPYSSLSFNIYQPDFDLAFLADYVDRFNLKRRVRLGLAHPIHQAGNLFIPAGSMQVVGNRLVSFHSLFSGREISLNMDCGFPLCMFDNESLGKMFTLAGHGMSFACGAALDIGTTLDAWPCFPLSGYEKRSLYDFSSYKEFCDYESAVVGKIRQTRKGIFPSCETCTHQKAGRCAGGCAAHVLSLDQASRLEEKRGQA